jgi:Na+/proline symporter
VTHRVHIRIPDGTRREVEVRYVLNGGYSGRDTEAVRHHVEEPAALGVPAPGRVPCLYPVSANLVTQTDTVQVPHARTSGESEWALLAGAGPEDLLLTVACDHTDRDREVHGVAWSKQSAPDVLGDLAWPLREVTDTLDAFTLRAWVTHGATEHLVREGTLEQLLPPSYWVEQLRTRALLRPGTVPLSGTIPMLDAARQFSEGWLGVAHHRTTPTDPPPALVGLPHPAGRRRRSHRGGARDAVVDRHHHLRDIGAHPSHGGHRAQSTGQGSPLPCDHRRAVPMNYGYLAIFVGYLLVVLAVGVWGYRRESYDGYIVAERDVGLPLSVGSFFATYISSATVVGFVGYTTLHGAAIFPTYFWGFALGWITLTLAAARMRRLGLRTVPSLFEARHRSPALRSISAVVIVVAFAFSVMTQLVAGSLVLKVVVGIPQVTGLVLLALVLIVYTVMGGLVAVVRTDFLQGGLILVGVFSALAVVFWRLGGDALRLEPGQTRLLAGSIESPTDVVAFLLIAWGGVAAQPYYLHRFFAARNTKTARNMIGVGALLAAVVYLAIMLIGMALPKLLPSKQLGDSAIVVFGLDQGGLLGSLLLVGIICAVQSTVDSALHLAGVYTTEDILVRFRPSLTERQRLALARTVTAVLGVVCMLGAVYFVVGGGSFIVTLLNIWLSTLSSALLIPLYGSLLWPRATRMGAICSSAGGFLGYFVTLTLEKFAGIAAPGHPIFYGFGISFLALVAVSLLTTPIRDIEVRERFFGTGRSEAEVVAQ